MDNRSERNIQQTYDIWPRISVLHLRKNLKPCKLARLYSSTERRPRAKVRQAASHDCNLDASSVHGSTDDETSELRLIEDSMFQHPPRWRPFLKRPRKKYKMLAVIRHLFIKLYSLHLKIHFKQVIIKVIDGNKGAPWDKIFLCLMCLMASPWYTGV